MKKLSKIRARLLFEYIGNAEVVEMADIIDKTDMIDVPQYIADSDGTVETSMARNDARTRIIGSTIRLLNSGGRDAVTTRAVADAAGVQAPTIYRLFRDKAGLLAAVAEHGFTTYLQEKMLLEPAHDPVEDLRTGWDLHVAFGLSHPAIYLLMCADPHAGIPSPAAEASLRLLEQKIRRVAAAGRLRLSEARALDLFGASACGTVLTLLAKEELHRDIRLSEIAREAALAAITTNAPSFESSGLVATAVALRAILPTGAMLSHGERALLTELLDRLASSRI